MGDVYVLSAVLKNEFEKQKIYEDQNKSFPSKEAVNEPFRFTLQQSEVLNRLSPCRGNQNQIK